MKYPELQSLADEIGEEDESVIDFCKRKSSELVDGFLEYMKWGHELAGKEVVQLPGVAGAARRQLVLKDYEIKTWISVTVGFDEEGAYVSTSGSGRTQVDREDIDPGNKTIQDLYAEMEKDLTSTFFPHISSYGE